MSYPPLTQDDDLAVFPGGPFPAPMIRAAEAMIRNAVGWHIAPQVTETIVVEASDRARLMLPSLKVVSVDSVTDENGLVLVDYVARPWGELLRRPATLSETGLSWSWTDPYHYWHPGRDYTIELTHGYESADDLLPVVAAFCKQQLTDGTLTQRSETVGQRTSSESYNVGRILDTFGVVGSPVQRYELHTFGR